MFRKVLVANRGEIAVRIIKTLKKMHIKAVAVYSEADEEAQFVKDADEAYFIGESQVQKSYLNIASIINVAIKANVDAIHPGYGFLSENSDFASACEEHGITFIGPQAKIIREMSNKLTARQLMSTINIPIVPGSNESIRDVNHAKQIANRLGYPVMLKASAGGGGIGISIVHEAAALEHHFYDSQQRADMYFGREDLYIEKYIDHARHIEVQVACDHQGNVLHLYERECSIQRRFQKIVEESPSSALPPHVRGALIEVALRAVKEIGYQNVGTIEFILDEDLNYYFLEMNTRIQVEHTVTEETLGIDIVDMQINIAAGLPLPYKQQDIHRRGHAIECRLYAEDPINHFPSPGEITSLRMKRHEGVRYDFGVCEGDVITPFYDPLLGKIITYGRSREQAVATMRHILTHIKITGVKTNLSVLQSVLHDNQFTNGVYTTSFLSREVIS